MIQKIEQIKNIGNYENYVAQGDVTLKKMNIIYAENGAGKTTLARILHSLGTNDSISIIQRKRIGATNNPEVQIKDDEGQLLFKDSKWNKNNPNIVVFDSYFVSDNVFTGIQIGNDQRKHLYKFVLGNIGVKIANKIERIKNLIDNKNNEISELAHQIQIESKCHDVDKFCKLKQLDNIDDLIESKKKELVIAQNNKTILIQSSLPTFPPIPIDFDENDLKSILSISIDGIGKEFLEEVKLHIDNLKSSGINQGASWIHTGFQAMKTFESKICPFCGNSIEGIKLIEGYNQYFNERYNNAVVETKKQWQKFADVNLDLYINQIRSFKERFENIYNFWCNYIHQEGETICLDFNLVKLKCCFDSLKNTIELKNLNPMDKITTNAVDDFVKEVKSLSHRIRQINKFVIAYNNKIQELKRSIRKIEDVAHELEDFELNKIRFSESIKWKCSIYALVNAHLKKLQKINKQFQEMQKNESNMIFNLYGEKINYFLNQVFHTKFRIDQIKDGGIKGRSKEATLNYILTFNGTSIEPEGENNTSFKNILSEGDKNTIAFSLFLAKLATESDLSRKIVVFDDPLTSLDLNRRNATIHQLVRLYQECSQIIVLSHNLHFLIELNSQTLLKKNQKKILQVINSNGKSSILEYQIKKDWINNYQKSLDIMGRFTHNPSPENQEDALNSIRISLETFLKLKYCCFIPDPDQTFGTIVNLLEKSDCSFINKNKKEVIDKLNQLVALSWRGHHGSVETRDAYTEEEMSMSEAQSYVEMTLKLLNEEL